MCVWVCVWVCVVVVMVMDVKVVAKEVVGSGAWCMDVSANVVPRQGERTHAVARTYDRTK